MKELWSAALHDSAGLMSRGDDRESPTHQNSAHQMQASSGRLRVDGLVRYPRKMSFGGNLYLLIRPQGGRYWHYHYRYGGKRKTLSLGTHPHVPTTLAQARRKLRSRGLQLQRANGLAKDGKHLSFEPRMPLEPGLVSR